MRIALTGCPRASAIRCASWGWASPASSFSSPGWRGALSPGCRRVSTRSPTLGCAMLPHLLLAGLATHPAARGVALHDPHLGPGDRQGPRGHVAHDHRVRRRRRVTADSNRCHEDGVTGYVSAVADLGRMLLEAVPVGGDGAGADVDVGADHRVADVAEMRNRASRPDPGVLDLG